MADKTILGGRWEVRGLYRRSGSLIWYGTVRDSRTGRVHRASTRTGDRKVARRRLLEFVRKLAARVKARPRSAIGFEKAFREWLDLKIVRPVTRSTYEIDLRGLYAPRFGRKRVSEIGLIDIEKFLKSLREERRAGARTLKKHLIQLRSFFRWTVHRRYRGSDPTAGIKIPRGEKRRRGIALTLEQAAEFLEESRQPAARTIRDRDGAIHEWMKAPPAWLFTAILIGLHTGLRRRNILDLSWRDVDFAAGRIAISGERMKSKADLEIPIHPELREHLGMLLRARGTKASPDEPVIGARIRLGDTSLAAVARRAGLLKPDGRPIGWHDLRRTFATRYAMRVSHGVLQALLGHGPQDVTGLYVRVPFEDLHRAVEDSPRLLPKASLDPGSSEV